MIQENDVGKSFQIFQCWDIFGKYLDRSINAGRNRWLNGSIFRFSKGRPNDANLPVCYIRHGKKPFVIAYESRAYSANLLYP